MEITIGSTPFTEFILPSSASSPINIISFGSSSTSSFAQRSDIAIARSNADPSFLIAAGAKLTVTLSFGNEYPELVIADLTLSPDSFTAVSARPTMVSFGIFLTISASTFTRVPSSPKSVTVFTFAYIFYLNLK